MTGTPAPSRAATMFRTLSTVNWCLIACEHVAQRGIGDADVEVSAV